MIAEEELKSKLANMEIKEDDQPLIQHIRDQIEIWLALPKDQQENYINIPEEAAGPQIPPTLNRYQMRLTHQVVKNEYPTLKTTSMKGFIQITNPSAEQVTRDRARKDEQHEKDISYAIGFRYLMEGIVGGDLSNMPKDY